MTALSKMISQHAENMIKGSPNIPEVGESQLINVHAVVIQTLKELAKVFEDCENQASQS